MFEGEMLSSPNMSAIPQVEPQMQPSTSRGSIQRCEGTVLSSINLCVVLEQRRLFNFGKRKNLPSSSHKKASKAEKVSKCAIKFCCLASKGAHKPPCSIKDRTDLCNMGLGDKSGQGYFRYF